MFIGREKELNALEKLYDSKKFEFAVVYGRRRVGKTSILSKFVVDKKAIYFTGIESNENQNLVNFSNAILDFTTSFSVDAAFPSFQSALDYVFRLSLKERIVLVIDEYPYVARASKSLPSTLQLLIDQYKESSKLMLILCGSSMSYIEDHVLAYKSPLYGRRTAQFKILPCDFFESCRYISSFNNEDKALIYGMMGGTAQYLNQINKNLSVSENIKNTFLNPISNIFEEPENLLKQEVKEPYLYNAIISAIASGASKLVDIANKVGETSSTCSQYIKNLISLSILKKEYPYGEENTRKTIYRIDDNMFRFYFRFVPSNISLISRGATDLVYKKIEPLLPDYMGKVFEDICQQYMWHLLISDKLPITFADIGRWWGNNPLTKSQSEIDLMARQDKETLLLGECKWTSEKVDLNVLESLMARSKIFHGNNVYFYLFAKTGFTKGCMDYAQQNTNIFLISFKEMMEEMKVSKT